MTSTIGKRHPRRRLLKSLTAEVTPTATTTAATKTAETLAMLTLSG
jgi:hypothetical protein